MKIEVDLIPFTVPSEVYGSMPIFSRGSSAPCWKLKDVPPEILATLCDQFRKDVFKVAGKEDPEYKK